MPLAISASSAGWLTFTNGKVQIGTHGLPAPGIYSEWIDLQEGRKPSLSLNVVRLPITVRVVPLSSVSPSPSEIISVDEMDYLSPTQFAWVPGSTHTLSVRQTIPGANGGLIFTHWSDMVATLTRQIIAPVRTTDVRSWNAIYVPDLPHFTATARTLDASNPTAAVFEINLSNSGPRPRFPSLAHLSLPRGTKRPGFVHLAAIPPGNISFVSPGQTGGFPLTANWPASVTRITVKVNYTCNGGAVTGSLTATINL